MRCRQPPAGPFAVGCAQQRMWGNSSPRANSSAAPADFQVIQEVLWDVRPDVLIELGTNTGGGALALASVMQLIEQSTKGTPEYKRMRIITIDPNGALGSGPAQEGSAAAEGGHCPEK